MAADPKGNLAALVFKTSADPYVGRLTYFRVYCGAITSNSQVWNVTRTSMNVSDNFLSLEVKTRKQCRKLAPVISGQLPN